MLEQAHNARLQNENGDRISVQLLSDGEVERGVLLIDGVPYHIERMSSRRLVSRYLLDDDPDYCPKTDSKGCCILAIPFSE